MSIEAILDRIRESKNLRNCITHWERIPARRAAYAPMPSRLDARLRAGLGARGIEQLYTHQAAAVEASLRGEDVVVVTPTASGKTLCYNLPVLDRLLREPDARALYLFPTKALAQDQRHELQGLIEAVGVPIGAEVYDGDTPTSARRRIRAGARILLTNPDMLHVGILPHHTRWLSLWSNLRYIVIDEVHHYRGLFGSHFANLLRRMQRIARFYGCEPQVIAASATIANPGELVEGLIDAELPVTVIDESGAPQGEKHFIFWNPPLIPASQNGASWLRRSSLLETRRVTAGFLRGGVQTIVFTRSRLSTEILLRYLRRAGEHIGLQEGALRGYRGGYLPLERREIEKGLREGAVRGVVSTNALELGIDIGELDACVMHGYPGTIASTWQQAGRAGRRAGTSVALLIASSHPLDQFIIQHPDWFFGTSPEHARINPDNLQILVNHIRCATFELPFAPGEGFGTLDPHVVREILAFLQEAGEVHSAADTYYWTAQSYPAQGVSLRSPNNDAILIIERPPGGIADCIRCRAELRIAERKKSEAALPAEIRGCASYEDPKSEIRPSPPRGIADSQSSSLRIRPALGQAQEPGTRSKKSEIRGCASSGDPKSEIPHSGGGVVIGEVDRFAVHQMCYPGAIYMHEGRQYLIKSVNWEENRADAHPIEVDYYTRPQTKTRIAHLESFTSDETRGRHWGEVQVTRVATGFKRIKLHTHEKLGTCDLNLPESQMQTTCYWLTFSLETSPLETSPLETSPLGLGGIEGGRGIEGGIEGGRGRRRRNYGPNWQQQRELARKREGFRCAHCRIHEEQLGRELDVHHLTPFRDFGYIPGQNDAYLTANQLSNLTSLCPTCHKRTEPWHKSALAAGLLGIANALGNIAPLFLMCDARDLGVTSETYCAHTNQPTIFIYETTPGGVGFAEQLFELHQELLHATNTLIRECPCQHGCPACVGPDGMVGQEGKKHALGLLEMMSERGN